MIVFPLLLSVGLTATTASSRDAILPKFVRCRPSAMDTNVPYSANQACGLLLDVAAHDIEAQIDLTLFAEEP